MVIFWILLACPFPRLVRLKEGWASSVMCAPSALPATQVALERERESQVASFYQVPQIKVRCQVRWVTGQQGSGVGPSHIMLKRHVLKDMW